MPRTPAPMFEIGQSVLYQQHYNNGEPPSKHIYSAVVTEIFNYGISGGHAYGTYYIKFDGDVVPLCGYEGLLQTIASQTELTPHTKSADYAKNHAAWLLEVQTVNRSIVAKMADERAAYVAMMTEKYGHIVPGLEVKWKDENFQYGYSCNHYKGTVTERNKIDYCYVLCTDGKTRSVNVTQLL